MPRGVVAHRPEEGQVPRTVMEVLGGNQREEKLGGKMVSLPCEGCRQKLQYLQGVRIGNRCG